MKETILITTAPPVLLAMNELPVKDWSDVIVFFIGFVLLCLLCLAFHQYFEEKNESKMTDTERNRRMMDAVSEDR